MHEKPVRFVAALKNHMHSAPRFLRSLFVICRTKDGAFMRVRPARLHADRSKRLMNNGLYAFPKGEETSHIFIYPCDIPALSCTFAR
jgi:2-phospho-L-lactate guanylyltransferase (CobY/MobA/RfbA family)